MQAVWIRYYIKVIVKLCTQTTSYVNISSFYDIPIAIKWMGAKSSIQKKQPDAVRIMS